MPDVAPAQTDAAASDKRPAHPVNPDRVGEELADDANIWQVYDRVAKEDDERRTKAWDNGLNNLALFAGLFSAVTTAFIIEGRQDLEPDYVQMMFIVLNATAFGEKPVQQPFVIPSSARTVNCLWVASLILSLSAALIAIMGKDWIGMYTARPVCNLRQWAELRSYRLRCVEQWHMSGMIAAAPVLLHISLVLFGAGLVLFISSDPVTHRLTLGLSLAAGILYLVTTVSAIVFSTSPFKSPATQMLRPAFTRFWRYMQHTFYRPRSTVRTTGPGSRTRARGRTAGGMQLPGHASTTGRSWQPFHQLMAGATAARRVAVACVRSFPTSACNAQQRLHRSLHSIMQTVLRLPVSDWLLSSTWTDIPARPRPELIADAMSWLCSASQAPDVFRAIVFALGDLYLGQRVGFHTQAALRSQLRAEIDRLWKHADFLTLSRYVLAAENTGLSRLIDGDVMSRFDELSKDPALRCEDGLAALFSMEPDMCDFDRLERCLPERGSQLKMLEFLLPRIGVMEFGAAECLILVAHRYRMHLKSSESLAPLEQALRRTLDAGQRSRYRMVTDKYGKRAGGVELLAFMCCDGRMFPIAKKAAVEVIMQVLTTPLERHPYLAYLFGNTRLLYATWEGRYWPSASLSNLWSSLPNQFPPSHPHTVAKQSDDRLFDLSETCTAALLLSAQNDTFAWMDGCIEFLCSQLRPAQSTLTDNGRLDVIRLLLKNGSLLRIVGMPDYFGHRNTIVTCGTAILVAIILRLERLLCEPRTVDDGEKLFGELVFTEVLGQNNKTVAWDLGNWIRTEVPRILQKCPSSASEIQGIHNALCAIYPLCATNYGLSVHWDRLGYPGHPGDIFSDPFVDIGAFFANAEAPRARPGDIFDDRWLRLSEFFDMAERF